MSRFIIAIGIAAVCLVLLIYFALKKKGNQSSNSKQGASEGGGYNPVKQNEVPLTRICMDLRVHTNYEARLSIIHFLFDVASLDGRVKEAEMALIERINKNLLINQSDFESVKAMFRQEKDDDYTILGLTKDASEADIKKAYRDMVKKYHPDRIDTNDAAVRRGAEQKFKRIQEAYESIQKQRGF